MACGPNWMRSDLNHVSYVAALCVEAAILFLLAIMGMNAAKKKVNSPIVDKVTVTNWFTEKQLLWVCILCILHFRRIAKQLRL